MRFTSIDTNPVHRRMSAMRKLTGALFTALLLTAVPASAASLAFQIDATPVLHSSTAQESAGSSPIAENRWPTGTAAEWNAGLSRAVDRLVDPAENADVYAVQTEDRLNDRFDGTHGPNETLAGFKIVFH
jgi:hypothetical protein